ncbi:hypothetical protein R1sor_001537 [Riccia sorocarpa]|uniref:Nucleotide-diphospho-sugar transferase domain-containing protein n=1 Tax=Riccia sorocarpa TaxID=122646 RepID=A0ABD3GZM0_9MARC
MGTKAMASNYQRARLEELPGLEGMLKETSMANKTVIVTALNAAWATDDSVIDLFLESFKEGDGIAHLLNHVLIVTLDQTAHNRCVEIHHHCFHLETEGVDFTGEKFLLDITFLSA